MPIKNYEIPEFSETKWLSITWFIYVQPNSKEIIQLEIHEIYLHNFKAVSRNSKKHTFQQAVLLHRDKNRKTDFFHFLPACLKRS